MKILAIIPAFNEESNIQRTVEDIRQCQPRVDILVVDDGSKDATCDLARQAGVMVARLPFNLGIGGAVQTGLIFAYRHGYDFALQVDGDGQHDAKYIDDLISASGQLSADVVVGSRFAKDNDGFQSSFYRRVGIRFFVYLINILTHVRVTDPTSGFRLFNRRAIELFAKNYPTDFPEPESIVLAYRMGLRIQEVPVKMRSRQGGNSSIRYVKTIYYMFKVTMAILLLMLKRKERLT